MRNRILLYALILAGATLGPAAAQHSRPGDLRTETMSRQAGEGVDNNLIWNVVGLLGLLGLLGLKGEHSEDSYHPAALE